MEKTRRAGCGLQARHEIMTDEKLAYLARRFISYSVRDLLGITFEQFLNDPDFYLDRACKLVGVIAEERARFQREAERLMRKFWTYCDMDAKHPDPATSIQ